MLSVIIIAKNESRHIGSCLNSVSWADEIIVFDSGSEDDTVKICRQYTDAVYQTDWPGYGIQKQRALNKANGDWVLSIDADETVIPELKDEINRAIQTSVYLGYEIPRLSSYCGKQIRHGGWWPDYNLRLFRREKGAFTNAAVHEQVIVEGELGKLVSPLIHDTYENLEEALEKMNSYSTLGAKMLYDAGVKSSLSKALARAAWTFVRTYLIKAAFLDGRHGFFLAVSSTGTTFYKYIKLLELQLRNAHEIK